MKFLMIAFIVFAFSCNSHSDIKRYYNANAKLHHALADSLHNFVIRHDTKEIILSRSLMEDKSIYFHYYVEEITTRVLIKYDSSLNRTDPESELTAKIEIPIEIIRLFKKTVYTSLIADSKGVFFGYKDDFNGNSKTGILVDYTVEENNDKDLYHLGKNVYITRGVIP